VKISVSRSQWIQHKLARELRNGYVFGELLSEFDLYEMDFVPIWQATTDVLLLYNFV
jgi:hypothetical protein